MLNNWRLSQVSEALGAQLLGADVAFSGVSTDSRTLKAGDLFVALSGPQFDGHHYLADVAAKGAAAVVVERAEQGFSLPQLRVANSRQALGQLGAVNRAAFSGLVAAVTGSSGKTTVKELLASILRSHYGAAEVVLATRGNLNNELGVPLTLLELGAQHRAAVIELGANHLGEIAYTVALAKPQVAVLTNAGNAHVGEFGGPENIVKAKGEIIEGLIEDGTAVLNLDDSAFAYWKERAGARPVLSFSLQRSAADFYATNLARDARGCMKFELNHQGQRHAVQLNLLGEHNVANALAAAAAAYALGVPMVGICQGLAALTPVVGRCVAYLAGCGARIIDDSYNANPLSMCAAVDILAGFSNRTVLVLGDMGELGDWAEAGHRQVGSYAQGKVDALYAVGPLMTHAVSAFGAGAEHFSDQASLIEALADELDAHTTLLIKGSRSAAMDKVVAALLGSAVETH